MEGDWATEKNPEKNPDKRCPPWCAVLTRGVGGSIAQKRSAAHSMRQVEKETVTVQTR